MIPQAQDSDFIAALASGPGPAAVSIIRISGRGLAETLSPMFRLKKQGALTARQAHLCYVVDPRTGEELDETLLLYFRAPSSFTGEDVIEIHCHGGPYIITRILSTLFKNGVRQAEPGEFTRRAFLNGKMDLTAAEGIRDLVNAQSHQQWLAARHLATGRLKDQIEMLRRLLIEAMAYLEAQIDFPDEGDTAHLHTEHVTRRTDQVRKVLGQLLASYQSGHVAARGLSVALYGAPNAGKSTLMNFLLGKERAIVTDIAGTTRDYIEEPCLINGRLIRLIDMAGIRESSDRVESIGIEHARKIAREADLVLVLNACDSDSDSILDELGDIKDREHLLIATKADKEIPAWVDQKWLPLSCANGQNTDELFKQLAAKVDRHVTALPEAGFITTERHKLSVEAALAGIERFYASLDQGLHEEMLAFELLDTSRHLKDIVGEISGEDILDKIFSEFCLGK